MISIGVAWYRPRRNQAPAVARPKRGAVCGYELGCLQPARAMGYDRLYAAVVPLCPRHDRSEVTE